MCGAHRAALAAGCGAHAHAGDWGDHPARTQTARREPAGAGVSGRDASRVAAPSPGDACILPPQSIEGLARHRLRSKRPSRLPSRAANAVPGAMQPEAYDTFLTAYAHVTVHVSQSVASCGLNAPRLPTQRTAPENKYSQHPIAEEATTNISVYQFLRHGGGGYRSRRKMLKNRQVSGIGGKTESGTLVNSHSARFTLTPRSIRLIVVGSEVWWGERLWGKPSSSQLHVVSSCRDMQW